MHAKSSPITKILEEELTTLPWASFSSTKAIDIVWYLTTLLQQLEASRETLNLLFCGKK